MSAIIFLLMASTSPFVFAGGLNIKALYTFILFSASLFVMQYSIKRWNAFIQLFLVITFGITAGVTVSFSFGFFALGFCLSNMFSDAKPQHEASNSARMHFYIVIAISFSLMLLSYCLALYDFFT